MIGTCKLCHVRTTLLNKSHIIPEFMYQLSGLFDEHHKIDRYERAGGFFQKVARPSSGEYEDGLLCAPCDSVLLGELETYARDVLYGDDGRFAVHQRPRGFPETLPDGMMLVHWENVEYAKFKLFLLSLLWRASVSRRKFFAEVRLGSHEDRVRRMLLDRNPGLEDEYRCVMLNCSENGELTGVLHSPTPIEPQLGYTFLIGGILYFYFLTDGATPIQLLHTAITSSNRITISYPPPGRGADLLRRYTRVGIDSQSPENQPLAG